MTQENETSKREVTRSTLRFFQTLQNSVAHTRIQDKVDISVVITAEGRPPWKFDADGVSAFAVWNAAEHILTTCDVDKIDDD